MRGILAAAGLVSLFCQNAFAIQVTINDDGEYPYKIFRCFIG